MITVIKCYFLLILVTILHAWVAKESAILPVCSKKACIDRGLEYYQNLRPVVNPCQDFYNYACGAWHIMHPQPRFAAKWTVNEKIHEETLKILKTLIEKIPSRVNNSEMIGVKWVYETCTKLPWYERYNPVIIAAEIRRIRRYPERSLWQLHNEYLKLTGESSLFDFAFLKSPSPQNSPFVVVNQPDSAYGSIYHGLTWTVQEERIYSDFLLSVLQSLQLPDTIATLKTKIFEVLRFRKQLNKIILDVKQNPITEIFTMTLNDFTAWFSSLVPRGNESKKKFAIPWKDIVMILLQNLPRSMIVQNRVMAITSVAYLQKLMHFFRNVSEKDLANHMEIYFIERHLKLTDFMRNHLQMSIQPYGISLIVRENQPRWQKCMEDSNIEGFLTELYIKEWLIKINREPVKQLTEGLRESIKRQIIGSEWLDNNTKFKIIKNLSEIDVWIGQPPWMENKNIRAKPTPLNELTPTAFLNHKEKVTYIHAPMLNSPIFHPDLPELYNAASIGFTIGHELNHVMGDCGELTNVKQTDKLWPPKMIQKCQERKKCFIEEYNKLTQKEFRKRYSNFPRIDTARSFTENFADVMGLEAAYSYYEKSLKPKKPQCEVLPGFQGYSCDQMFFIAFANVFCGNPPANLALEDLETSRHSLNSVRLNGAVANNAAFAKAFQCAPRDPLNPNRRCNLWI